MTDKATTDYSALPIFKQAANNAGRCAVIDGSGEHSYSDVLVAARRVAAALLAGEDDLREARVTFMVPPGFDYVTVQWGIWLAGGVAVPHCVSHPEPELEYTLSDTRAAATVAAPEFSAKLESLAARHQIRLLTTDEALNGSSETRLPTIGTDRRAMILYTSGTTSKPKGVVMTHRNNASQIVTLLEAWGWTADDHILNVLPLHHTHGIINVLSCALWAGATCELLPRFEAEQVWQSFVERPFTLFMAVPTIYNRLVAAWEDAPRARQKELSAACNKFRLMVSGSAALPVSTHQKWREISGHTLLERYGMTEIGMALSNPLEDERRPGCVGQPLPGVTARIMDENGAEVTEDGPQGELQIKGGNVFLEYWQRPQATQEAFVDGWFKTGDVVVREDDYFRILGRSSIDIIKTGGYKVSALEIEEVLRTHAEILECAVVGVEDSEWGEVVCAAVTVAGSKGMSIESFRAWAKEQLAPYKVPSRVQILEALPRNVMGKVTKPAIKKLFEREKSDKT